MPDPYSIEYAIAYALRRSPFRVKAPKGIRVRSEVDECDIAAAEVARHLRDSGWRIERPERPTIVPSPGFARGAPGQE